MCTLISQYRFTESEIKLKIIIIMINTVEYIHRISNLSDLDSISLPNAFRCYIQCRTKVENPTSNDIYCFESHSSKIYVSGSTLQEIVIYDYSYVIERGETLRSLIESTLSDNNLQMKMGFISKL